MAAIPLRNRRSFRLFTHFCRVLAALPFVFSGAVKSIDPWGTALSVNNYLVSYGLEAFKPIAMIFSIWLCGAELMMGCMLLFKVRIRMCSTFATASMIIFTIITFLGATFIPVEDCGCFGDVVKLTPWQSFIKNLILLPLILVVWWRYRPDRMFAFSRLEFAMAVFFCVFSMGVGTYCYMHLPPVDLLPYKEGTNIAQAMDEARNRQQDSEVVLIYRNRRTGKLREFSIDDKEWQNDKKWEWVETRVDNEAPTVQTLVSEFSLSDVEGNVTEEILTRPGRVYMICVTNFSKLRKRCAARLRSVVERAEAEGALVVCLTPQPLRYVTRYSFDGSDEVRCYNIDATVMKTMLRAENGLVVLNDGVIEDKYNCRSIDFME